MSKFADDRETAAKAWTPAKPKSKPKARKRDRRVKKSPRR